MSDDQVIHFKFFLNILFNISNKFCQLEETLMKRLDSHGLLFDETDNIQNQFDIIDDTINQLHVEKRRRILLYYYYI